MIEFETDDVIYARLHQKWILVIGISLVLFALIAFYYKVAYKVDYKEVRYSQIVTLIGFGIAAISYWKDGGIKSRKRIWINDESITIEYKNGYKRHLAFNDVDKLRSGKVACDMELYSKSQPWNDKLSFCMMAIKCEQTRNEVLQIFAKLEIIKSE